MRRSYKAALLSAFVFPGLGQIYLKKTVRGLIIMSLMLVGLGIIVWKATVASLPRLDGLLASMQIGTVTFSDLSSLTDLTFLASFPYNVLYLLLLCCWLLAVIDAFIAGKKIEK